MISSRFSAQKLIESFPFFADMSDLVLSKVYTFDTGEHVSGGNCPDGCLLLLKGSIDVFRATIREERERIGIVNAGEIAGEGFVLGKTFSPVDLIARELTTIAYIDHEIVEKLISEHHEAYEELLKMIATITNRRLIDVDYELALVYGLGELSSLSSSSPDALREVCVRMRDLLGLVSVSIVEIHPVIQNQNYLTYDSISASVRPLLDPVVMSDAMLTGVFSIANENLTRLDSACFGYTIPLKIGTQKKGYMILVGKTPEHFTPIVLRVAEHMSTLIASMVVQRQEMDNTRAMNMRLGYA